VTLLLVLLLTVNVPDAAQFVGAPQGAPMSGEQLHRETTRVAGLLRCPVCQGLSVADSPSEMAVNMKSQVRDLLARGYTEEQILRYFELSYGQFVLLQPKFEGVNAMVWLLPVIALGLGLIVLWLAFKRLRMAPATAAAPPSIVEDDYVARVRDLVGKS
jgi:cytochrome c-type biogenesis protein CcmH